ncbi:unnamed protein product [Larinioides sclopetarius]|uniref:BTB domain-containing protein n=1 Tax=Larinioides sclopetarius TaxID=280406 RepID=A0AAV2AP14_9ARAC
MSVSRASFLYVGLKDVLALFSIIPLCRFHGRHSSMSVSRTSFRFLPSSPSVDLTDVSALFSIIPLCRFHGRHSSMSVSRTSSRFLPSSPSVDLTDGLALFSIIPLCRFHGRHFASFHHPPASLSWTPFRFFHHFSELVSRMSFRFLPSSPYVDLKDVHISLPSIIPQCRSHGPRTFTSSSPEHDPRLSEKQTASSANKESKQKIQLKSLEELSKDLERVLSESSRFADVTLKCGGASIPAHKIILSARSPVFAAMFVNPMKESLRNEVDITDIHESALRDLLKYVYTGKTCDLTDSSAAELLNAADKYQIQDLKAVCVDFLKNTVSLQNV